MIRKVCMAMAHGGYVEPQTYDCWLKMFVESGKRSIKYDVGQMQRGGCFLSLSRSLLALQAIQEGADAVMMIDSDQTFPAHALDRLVAHDLPYVGCSYRKRDPEKGYPLINPLISRDNDQLRVGGLAKVDYLPGGFQLVKAEVYEAIGFPFYRCDFGLTDHPPEEFVGDDTFFGQMARNAGYDIWCDLDLTKEIGHLLKIDLKWGPSTPLEYKW